MASSRPSFVVLAILFLSALLSLSGCGSDEWQDPNESETTRAIREKVRTDMERDRLERIGRRLAPINEGLARAPSAVVGSTVASDGEDAEASSEAGTEPIDGAAIYARNCAGCHGAQGDGDGPLSASLVPKPAQHSDGTYMNALSDAHLFKVISEGGAAVGKSNMMAPWGPTLSDEEIRSVIAFIRTLADPPYEGATSDAS
jgi:mono/diheme cytochrome c family protein